MRDHFLGFMAEIFDNHSVEILICFHDALIHLKPFLQKIFRQPFLPICEILPVSSY